MKTFGASWSYKILVLVFVMELTNGRSVMGAYIHNGEQKTAVLILLVSDD